MRPKRSAARPSANAASASTRPAAVGRQAAERYHLAGQRHGHLVQARVARAFALQVVDRLDNLEGVADIASQNTIHVGDQRHGRQAGLAGHRDQALGKIARHRLGIAEGARPARHVHHQPIEPLGDLLRQDRFHDQGNRSDAAGDVAMA